MVEIDSREVLVSDTTDPLSMDKKRVKFVKGRLSQIIVNRV